MTRQYVNLAGLSMAFIMLCMFPPASRAQFLRIQQPLSGNLLVSTYEIALAPANAEATSRATTIPEPAPPGTKSPILAVGLSFLIPGLGEYYVGDQSWRGMIFTGLEVGLWLERYHWLGRGDDSTATFRAFGDSYWSPGRYADYLNSLLNSRGVPNVANGNDLNTINRAEAMLDSLGFPDFSHRLPVTDRQQYYELISKYNQFSAGWDDNTNPMVNASPHAHEHAVMRADMNDQYAVADYFLYGIILNHVLSAIDAGLLVHDHNTRLRLHGELLRRSLPDGTMGYLPTASLEYRF